MLTVSPLPLKAVTSDLGWFNHLGTSDAQCGVFVAMAQRASIFVHVVPLLGVFFHGECVYGLGSLRVKSALQLGSCHFFFSISIMTLPQQLCPACAIISFLSLQITPSIFSALHVLLLGTPRHPTSNGKHHVFHTLARHCSTKSAYFAILRSWSSYILSSYGRVNSISTHTRLFFENSTMSDR